jgi:hypothetical protein
MMPEGRNEPMKPIQVEHESNHSSDMIVEEFYKSTHLIYGNLQVLMVKFCQIPSCQFQQ